MKLKHGSDTSTTFGTDTMDIWTGRPTTSQDVFDETQVAVPAGSDLVAGFLLVKALMTQLLFRPDVFYRLCFCAPPLDPPLHSSFFSLSFPSLFLAVSLLAHNFPADTLRFLLLSSFKSV